MKKAEKTELTKEKILKAAMEEFGTNGYMGASVNTICKAGIQKGLLYHNFKNKDALYLACVERCFQSLTKYLKDADIGDDLEKYMRIRMEYFEKNKMEARIFFDAILQPPEMLNDQIVVLRKEFDEFSRELYGNILDSMELRQEVTYEDAMEYFTMMQYMFNGYFSSQICCKSSFSDKISIHETNLPKVLDLMLYGIARR